MRSDKEIKDLQKKVVTYFMKEGSLWGAAYLLTSLRWTKEAFLFENAVRFVEDAIRRAVRKGQK